MADAAKEGKPAPRASIPPRYNPGMRVWVRRGLAAWLLVFSGCGLVPDAGSAKEAFAEAEQNWQARDDFAHRAWLAIDPGSPEGARARARLAQADTRYRAGLRAFRAGDSATARAHFVSAAALAPIDPHHYLSLARAYAERGMSESAAKYYRKYLRALPDATERAQLERELAALELDPTEVLEPPPAPPDAAGIGGALWPLATSVPLLSALLLVWAGRRRGREQGLHALIERHPELHPTIAYLIGSLRHELLKHRVAAVSDALGAATAAGSGARALSDVERAFVHARLAGVDAAFGEHASSFARELGHLLTVERDPLFRGGARAARAVERALPDLTGPRGLARLRAGHAELLALDRELAQLQQRLVRTRIDAELLRELVRRAYTEVDLRSAAIDDLECRAEGLPVLVEVLRSDLLLVLRNLLRNAVFAAARGAAPRLVRLVVTVELEPTGQEFVCLAVQDSSEEPLTQGMIAESGLGRGLGLSAAAVRRYGGSLSLAPADPPLHKQVCVRFARVFGDTREEP